MKTAARTPRKLPTTYSGLCARHMPRPIHDKVGYDNAVEMIDALAGHSLNADQTDYLEILSRLVEDYDAAHHKLPAVRGIAALAYLLEENDLTGDDLAALLEVDRSTAYKILKGNRGLTPAHLAALSKRFKVHAELFIEI